ncbi:MAG: hypothetical protein ACJ75I_05660 [Solirubrobacterales bacterium]
MGETRTTTIRGTRRRTTYVLAFAALCAALVLVAVAIPSADASRAKVIGNTKHTPGPACPKGCKVIGRVTGFMTVADGKKRPYRAREDGKIVAWSVDLGKPSNTKKNPQRNNLGALFGNEQFGKQPTARIAVLKHKKKRSYKLLRQSPVMELGGVLGQKETFTLAKPLTVREGNIVAITSPTWTPNFHQRHLNASDNKWRASRRKDNCSPPDKPTEEQVRRFVRKSHAHQKVGTVHNYECLYSHARLLYWAYYVPTK